jgi:hypothetical protein
MADNLRLVVMTFPQRWDPGTATLHLNVLLVPSVSPVDDPLVGTAPKFADHIPTLKAVVIPSLDSVPKSGDPTAVRFTPIITRPNPPVITRPNYQKLVTQAQTQGVTISGSGALKAPSQSTIRKALPQSYLDASGAAPNGSTTTTDEFGCEIRGQPVFTPGPKVTTTGWGPMISYALRQPALAEALGLRYEMHVRLTKADMLNAGGWLFVELAANDPWTKAATPGQIRLYAARLPALSAQRQVFAAVIFPVDAEGAIDDSAFNIAETYDDGFAQVVHLFQPQANDAVVGDGSQIPAASDIGIQIGWDDEQVVAWQNGQIQILNQRMAGSLDAQTPLGVMGYRVDVADITAKPPQPDWHSLVKANVSLPQGFGQYRGELSVEPTAVRPQDPNNPAIVSGDAWLPRYFANWRGGSLVEADNVPKAMMDGKPLTPTPDPVGILLSYGRTYEFRVRLADLSLGGAQPGDQPVNVDPADTAALDFRRTLPPKKPLVKPAIPAGKTIPEALIFSRPLIGYPEVLYTGLGDTDANRRQIISAFTQNSAPGSGVVVGVPDPDAQTLELVVEVRTPLHDVAGDGVLDSPFRVLYTTTRSFPSLPGGPLPVDPGLRLDIAYVDAPSIVDWAEVQPSSGPLVIPRARDVRITARALTRVDPAYFSPSATIGLPASLMLRAELRSEPALLIRPVSGSQSLRGFLFRRPVGVSAPPVAAQMAQELVVVANGLTLSAHPGQRIAFGASKSLRHTLSGDNSALTFASESELLSQWVVALVVDLERDWTWDGLAKAYTLTVERDGQVVGSLTVPRTLGAAAVADPANWDRRRTLLVFFDGVDPHELTASGFPEALQHTWTIQAEVVSETGSIVGVSGTPALKPGTVPPPSEPELNGVSQALTLPIAVPPSQIPEIASVGLALSPFTNGAGYATTAARTKFVWIELKEPIQNQSGDALFARILTHGADPLLYDVTPSTYNQENPALVLDLELMREIIPGESDDRSGLDAMSLLEQASDSQRHFLLPLPPGFDPSDPDLFGFYSYELRIGHAGDPHDHRWWSTAQARFGRPLQVNGVQHPAPALVCRAGRFNEPVSPGKPQPPADIFATATFATPTLNGQPLVKPYQMPKTTLFFFLYAQVVQSDAASNRNVLLIQRRGNFFGGPDANRKLSVFGGPFPHFSQRDRLGGVVFQQAEIDKILAQYGLPTNLPLSILAAEFLPGGVGNDLPDAFRDQPSGAARAAAQDSDPLNLDGRPRRILRVSPLVQVAPVC